MTRRGPRQRPAVDHKAVAGGLREMPGVELLIGTYRARYTAVTMAAAVRNATKNGSVYAPAGTFDARVEPVGEETGLYVRYLGQPGGSS